VVRQAVLWRLYVYGQWSDGGPKRKQRYLVCIVLWWGLLTNEKVALDDRGISTSRHTLLQNDGRWEGRISSKKEKEK